MSLYSEVLLAVITYRLLCAAVMFARCLVWIRA